ncbi:MAG TPA: transcription termination factor NusA [Patescibacteria group bacterium]|nr:transcription termination factor NusA [Patescibacteria group bacterium]
MQTPRTEFAQALRAIAAERDLDPEVIIDTIKQAIVAAYKRDAKDQGVETEEFEYEVELNPSNGEAKVFSWPLEKPEEKKDVTPPGFGRIAAQTAKQVIHQKIREAEKGAIISEYSEKVGSLVTGMILRFEGSDVRVDLGKTEGIMPASERVPNERLNANQRLTFLLKEITETPKGKLLTLSRSDPQFVQKLFAREVPEIGSGSVEVKGIVREPGVRSKIAVFSNQSGVDPVGSCVGQKGVRVQSVTNELGGERVDIVPFNIDLVEFVKAALSPAEGLSVSISKDKTGAIVKAPEDQLSLAIGREGQNARLASKLTGVKIDIEGIPGEKTPKSVEKEEVKVKTEEKADLVPSDEKPAEEAPLAGEADLPTQTQPIQANDSASNNSGSAPSDDQAGSVTSNDNTAVPQAEETADTKEVSVDDLKKQGDDKKDEA